MPFNATNFRNSLQDISSPAYFEVIISSLPNVLTDLQNSDTTLRNLSFRVFQTELPSRQFETLTKLSNGAESRIPYGVIYGKIGLMCLEDSKNSCRKFFDEWLDKCFNILDTYTIPYYKDLIIPDMKIICYDKSGNESMVYRFYDIFPLDIGATRLSWADKDQIMTFPVELSYREYKLES